MVKVFLTTANVGSVFENLEEGLETWMREIISTVTSHNPQFVAIHFQETGGKEYKNGSDVIDIFFSALVKNFAAVGLELVDGFIDSNAAVETEFTALASVYFIRQNLNGVQIWNFQDKEFVPVLLKHARLHSGRDLPSTSKMHKEKFPQHFYPNSVWSRKGYLRTRWNFQGTIIELVNIHLFHDSSNLTASLKSPSPFAQNRLRTLSYVLEKLQNDDPINLPRFIFGDFNFRVNTYEVFDILRKESACVSEDGSEQSESFEVDAKYFKVNNLEERFKHNFHWLRPYDFEASQFGSIVGEFDVNFHPTYPFDETLPDKFMRTRCPAWCDRVLFTQNAVDSISKEFPTEYNLIGGSVCMGDHKPVYLTFELKTTTIMEPENNDEPNQLQVSNPTNSGISTPSTSSIKHKCGFVSFLRNNLSLRPHCITRSRNNDISSKLSSPTNSVVETRSGGKCCFRSNTNSISNSTVPSMSLEDQAISNTNKKTVKQNILISKHNDENIGESKDVELVKPIFILDSDSLKANSICRTESETTNSITKTHSIDNRRSASLAQQTKCCVCHII